MSSFWLHLLGGKLQQAGNRPASSNNLGLSSATKFSTNYSFRKGPSSDYQGQPICTVILSRWLMDFWDNTSMYCGVPFRICGLFTLLVWKGMADTDLEAGDFKLNTISIVIEINWWVGDCLPFLLLLFWEHSHWATMLSRQLLFVIQNMKSMFYKLITKKFISETKKFIYYLPFFKLYPPCFL